MRKTLASLLFLAGTALNAQVIEASYLRDATQVRHVARYKEAAINAKQRGMTVMKYLNTFPSHLRYEKIEGDGGEFRVEVGSFDMSKERFYMSPTLNDVLDKIDSKIAIDPRKPPRVCVMHRDSHKGHYFMPPYGKSKLDDLMRAMISETIYAIGSQKPLNITTSTSVE